MLTLLSGLMAVTTPITVTAFSAFTEGLVTSLAAYGAVKKGVKATINLKK